MIVLGIETTCDETACALVKNGREILSSVIFSQTDIHTKYGGVVPELSCRTHVDLLLPILKKALVEADLSLTDIDLIAVAHGPGLVGALLIGVTAAKALSIALEKPFVGVNHVEAHLYAALMSQEADFLPFPCLGAVLSGGHTVLVRMEEIGKYALIGQTVDDAIGEAFDKVAKILNLPYPGGPQIEALALKGDASQFAFKGGKVKGHPLNFSFSGLKTAVLYALKGQNAKQPDAFISEKTKANLAAAFQQTALNDVIDKILLAAEQTKDTVVLLGGGVTNNKELRRLIACRAPKIHAVWPSKGLSLDNAAMIAGLGYHCFLKKGKGDSLDLQALPRIPFGEKQAT